MNIKANTEKIKDKKVEILKSKAAKRSIVEGSFATVSGSFGNSYIVPFAVAANASNPQIAWLQSFPGLLGPMSQWLSSRLIEKNSRKKIVLFAVLVEGLLWLPLIILSLLLYKGILTGIIPFLIIVFFSVYTIFSAMSGPAWFSWMGDIINEKDRGKYFAKRNIITSIVAIITTLMSGFLLDYFKANNELFLGFAIFFFIAMTFRLSSRELFKKQYEPKIKLEKEYYFSFLEFIKKMRSNNFGRFTIFRTTLSLTVQIAAPFFAVYMLRDLGFSYLTFTIVILSPTIFGLLVAPLWGRFSDKYGNYQVMKITSIGVGIIPLLWLFTRTPAQIIFGPQLISGIAWTGFNLAASNFIYDTVTPQRRGLCVAYYNLLNGFGIFIGASLGAIIAKYGTDFTTMNILLVIFFISGTTRLLLDQILVRKFHEVRKVKKFSKRQSLRQVIHKTFTGLVSIAESTHETFAIKRVIWKRPK